MFVPVPGWQCDCDPKQKSGIIFSMPKNIFLGKYAIFSGWKASSIVVLTCSVISSRSSKSGQHKQWNFPLRISSVNVTKSTVFFRFGHTYWRNPLWKTSFFMQCKTKLKLGITNWVSTQNFPKNSYSYSLMRTRTYTYHWIRNVSFFEDFAYALNRSSSGNNNDFIIFLVEPRRRKKKTKKTRRAWLRWFEYCNEPVRIKDSHL